jgi:hypothetical protein
MYILHLMLFSLSAFLLTLFIYFLLLSSYVYLLYYVCIVVLTLDVRLLAKSYYQEGPATGHFDTGFSWFPCVYKRMLRPFPSFQVATICLSCSPPDLNSPVTFFPLLWTCKITTATGKNPIVVNKYYYILKNLDRWKMVPTSHCAVPFFHCT